MTLFENLSETKRSALFLKGCIPARLTLIVLVLLFGSNPVLRTFVSTFAALATIRLLTADTSVWWNRRKHAVFAILIAIAAVLGSNRLAAVLMLADLLFGINTFRLKPGKK